MNNFNRLTIIFLSLLILELSSCSTRPLYDYDTYHNIYLNNLWIAKSPYKRVKNPQFYEFSQSNFNYFINAGYKQIGKEVLVECNGCGTADEAFRAARLLGANIILFSREGIGNISVQVPMLKIEQDIYKIKSSAVGTITTNNSRTQYYSNSTTTITGPVRYQTQYSNQNWSFTRSRAIFLVKHQ